MKRVRILLFSRKSECCQAPCASEVKIPESLTLSACSSVICASAGEREVEQSPGVGVRGKGSESYESSL